MAVFATAHQPSPDSEAFCPECSSALRGKFCHECGAKLVDHHEYTLRHFFSHLLHEVTHFDSKIFLTVKVMAMKPGLLVSDYLAGRRKRYVPPLRLFLITFALYLFLFTAFKTTAMYSTELFHQSGKSPLANAIAKKVSNGRADAEQNAAMFEKSLAKIAEKRHTTSEALKEQLNERIEKGAHWLQFGEVFTFAMCVTLLFWSRKRYFVEHLVFSLNMVTFMLVLAILTWPYYMWQGGISAPWWAAVLSGAATLTYLYCAAKRVYGGSRGALALQTVGMFFGIQLSKIFFLMLTFFIAAVSLIFR